ncbi:heat shock protein beta-7 [Trichomycterus rosablanca]|uniref:heat shock protein beta-7 n=1 Tax=Trichomycterus rosablanca TaxID=2290929 RepID=UPI002F353C60
MNSLTGTSSSRSSSSSYRSSSRYSCSSVTSIQTDASLASDPRFLPFQRSTPLFGSHDANSPLFLSLGDESETFGGYQGDRKSQNEGYQGDWKHGDPQGDMGALRVDDSYYLSADVSRFEPHDIVVMAFNNSVVIHAEKVGDDGGVRDRFTHKSLLPEDMDPLSVSGTLTSEGTLVVRVRSTTRSSMTSSTPTFHSETLL